MVSTKGGYRILDNPVGLEASWLANYFSNPQVKEIILVRRRRFLFRGAYRHLVFYERPDIFFLEKLCCPAVYRLGKAADRAQSSGFISHPDILPAAGSVFLRA